MASLLGRFHRTHPSATIEFVIDHTERLTADLDEGGLDVAIVQVDDDHLRTTDTVLWHDESRWVTGSDRPATDDDVVALITFGDHCFYRGISEPILTDAGIEHRVAYSANSLNGVRAAISAGLGVGVLGARYLDADIVPWRPGDDLPPMPHVHQVIRTVPGDVPAVSAALVAAVSDELTDPALVAVGA